MSNLNALNLSLVQTHTHWHDPAANQKMFERWFADIPADTHVVVLPEMFSTGFTMASREVAQLMSGETLNWLAESSASLDKVICGSVVIEEEGTFYNRFVWQCPDGHREIYDKRHCFRMADEHKYYSPGSSRLIFEYQGIRICPMICYDLRFPVWFRNQGDYDVLLCVANWPAARRDAWNTLLRARAIENQVYVAGVNIVGRDGNQVKYSGGSAIYAPDGKVLTELFDNPGMINQTLDMDTLNLLRESFPVWRDADPFTVG